MSLQKESDNENPPAGQPAINTHTRHDVYDTHAGVMMMMMMMMTGTFAQKSPHPAFIKELTRIYIYIIHFPLYNTVLLLSFAGGRS